MIKRLLSYLLFAGAVCLLMAWMKPAVTKPGELLAGKPRQHLTLGMPIKHNGFLLFPLASYQLDARVLARKFYSEDIESEVAPIDLTVGWGPMSRDELLSKVSISLDDRFFHWENTDKFADVKNIRGNVANVHIIPANPQVRQAVFSAVPGQYLALKGSLVYVLGEDGWRWMTSLTRMDEGAGACELFYVTSVQAFRPGEPASASGQSVSAPAATPVVQRTLNPPAVQPVQVKLSAPLLVKLTHGRLTVPVNGVITIVEQRDGQTKGRYNGFEFVVPSRDVR